MKVSLDLVKWYGNGFDPLADGGVDGVVGRVGAQLGAIENVEIHGPKFDGIVVVRVVSCEKHPNADKLHVCKIDDGGVVKGVERDSNGLVQVVCGAPNVRTGLTVAWLPPGSTVPTTHSDAEPFVLSARELRGVVSNGMLASANELGISDDHTGLLEITSADVGEELTQPGTPFKKLYGLDDVVLDLENKMFTHRPDCFGTLGVARELAGIAGAAYSSPAWYVEPVQNKPSDVQLPLSVANQAETVVPRFMAQIVAHVTVGRSPIWLQAYLSRVGIKSINNVVDMTNYYMMLTGQPLHAFDYDKLTAFSSKPSLGPRMARAGEQLTLLGGKKVALTTDDIVIATDTQAVALAGVMGGEQAEVDDATKNIVIECATFDMYSIRRTSMRHGLFTDAVTRYTKGQSPLQNDRVLAKIVEDLVEKTGGVVASEAFDLRSKTVKMPSPVTITTEFVNDRLGSKLSETDIRTLLENVEFGVNIPSGKNEIIITPPYWRTDIDVPEDLVEEVGRLYGYSRLPVELPVRPSVPARRKPLRQLKDRVRSGLKSFGANEVLSYSFVHERLMRQSGQDPIDAYKLSNAISPDLQYYRFSLTPSLLEKVHPNLRAGYEQFALYEIGKGHNRRLSLDGDGLPAEQELLSLVFAASAKADIVGPAFYQARAMLDALGTALGVNFVYKPFCKASHDPLYGPFDRSRSAMVYTASNDRAIGVVGEYTPMTRKSLKLPAACAGFEVDLMQLLAAIPQESDYVPLPRFPKVSQDISLKLPSDAVYEEVRACLAEAIATARPSASHYTFEPVDIYVSQSGDKHMTFRLTIAHYERTLTAEEVNELLDIAAAAAGRQCAATRL